MSAGAMVRMQYNFCQYAMLQVLTKNWMCCTNRKSTRNLFLCQSRLSGIAALRYQESPQCNKESQSLILKAARTLLDSKIRQQEQHLIGCIERLVGDRPRNHDLNLRASSLYTITLDAIGVACHASATCPVPARSYSVEAIAICDKAIACELIL